MARTCLRSHRNIHHPELNITGLRRGLNTCSHSENRAVEHPPYRSCRYLQRASCTSSAISITSARYSHRKNFDLIFVSRTVFFNFNQITFLVWQECINAADWPVAAQAVLELREIFALRDRALWRSRHRLLQVRGRTDRVSKYSRGCAIGGYSVNRIRTSKQANAGLRHLSQCDRRNPKALLSGVHPG